MADHRKKKKTKKQKTAVQKTKTQKCHRVGTVVPLQGAAKEASPLLRWCLNWMLRRTQFGDDRATEPAGEGEGPASQHTWCFQVRKQDRAAGRSPPRQMCLDAVHRGRCQLTRGFLGLNMKFGFSFSMWGKPRRVFRSRVTHLHNLICVFER